MLSITISLHILSRLGIDSCKSCRVKKIDRFRRMMSDLSNLLILNQKKGVGHSRGYYLLKTHLERNVLFTSKLLFRGQVWSRSLRPLVLQIEKIPFSFRPMFVKPYFQINEFKYQILDYIYFSCFVILFEFLRFSLAYA